MCKVSHDRIKTSFKFTFTFLEDVKLYTIQIGMIEKVFTMKSSCAYPNIEGSVLASFIGTYIQTQEWDTACRYYSNYY